jgi:HNH endonuclease
VIYRSQGGPDTVDNLITLCQPCHAKAHSNKRRYAPLLLACLEFHRQGRSVTIAQVERWANK